MQKHYALAAMMALQYEHAGLAPLWPVLEAASSNIPTLSRHPLS